MSYATSAEHLRDELARVDLLVRAQVVRWRRTIAAAKPEQLWGMVHVSDAEIDQYLATEPAAPGQMPDALAGELRPYWRRENEVAGDIRLAVGATPENVDLRSERLRVRFGLTDAELDVILIALLPELDLRYRRIFGYLQDDASRSSPPVDLVSELLHPKLPTLEEKSALFELSGSLLRWRLVHIVDRAVRIDARIASFLLGHDGVDRALEAIVHPVPIALSFDAILVDGDTKEALEAFARNDNAPSIVVLHGPAGSGRADAARAISGARGLRLLRVDVEKALRDPAQWESLVKLAVREARLQNAALYLDGGAQAIPPFETAGTLTFIAAEAIGETESRHLRFDFSVPRYETRRAIWLHRLPVWSDREEIAEKLAASFQLTAGQIRDAIDAARTLAQRRSIAEPRITAEDLYEACRRQSGRRLTGFARRIEPKQGLTIDDVILSRANRVQLRELRDRVKLRARLSEKTAGRTIARGEGLLVLFAGPSGTGKTLAAESIASEQGVDLYKVDASAVVSKWVGETEKNLARVFADAEGSDALLFFDECDSLFGQRGEISDGQDRWANLQVNYLLQRVEDYPGVIILATNLRSNLDEAFLRRIRMILEFPPPDATLRLDLWIRGVAGWEGLSEKNLHEIAERFTLTGGSIRNVAIESMFRALAKDRETLEVRDVVASAAREYQKLGRPITKGEFGEEFYAWAVADVIAPPE